MRSASKLRIAALYSVLLLLWCGQAGAYTACVTGGGGFLAQELIAQLCAQGEEVVATARGRNSYSLPALDGVKLVHGCDLLEEGSFDEAFRGAHVVFHASSPFPLSLQHANERQLVVRACVEGTLNVMRSARRAGVRRVVVTSSAAALRASGQKPVNGEFFTASDWNVVSAADGPGMEAYQFGKTEAEKQAFRFGQDQGIEVASVLPTFLIGPPRSLGVRSASLQQVRRWLRGEGKVQTRLICDVRDAARAHLAAAKLPPELLSESRRFIVGQERRTSGEELRELLIQGCKEVSLPAAVAPADPWVFSQELKDGKEVETAASLRALGLGRDAEDLLPVAQTVRDMLRVLAQEERN